MRSIFKCFIDQDIFIGKIKLTRLYGTMYLQLVDYTQYYDSLLEIFGTNINSNLRCCHGYINNSGKKKQLGSKKTWGIFHLDFIEAKVIIPCPRTIMCNPCDQNILTDDIFDDGGKLYEQDDSGFLSSLKK